MRVQCSNTGKTFDTFIEAAEWANTTSIDIARQILGVREYAGINPVAGYPLRWNCKGGGGNLRKGKPLKCITNGKTFISIAEAYKWSRTTDVQIKKQIKGAVEFAGKDPDTGEPLKWIELGSSIYDQCDDNEEIQLTQDNTDYRKATDKQKNYIRALLNNNIFELKDDVNLETISLEEAQIIISVLLGNAEIDEHSKKYFKYDLMITPVEKLMIVEAEVVDGRGFEFQYYYTTVPIIKVYEVRTFYDDTYEGLRVAQKRTFIENVEIELKNEDNLKEFAINYMRNNVIK